jgi:DNA-binding XRE family transcriptional regulator
MGEPLTTMFGPKPCRKCGRDHYKGECPSPRFPVAKIAPQGVEVVYRRLGEWVRRARKLRGLRQEDVDALMGLTRTSIVNIEAGRQRVLLHDTLALLVILGGQEAVQRFYDCLVVPGSTVDTPAGRAALTKEGERG